MAPFESHSAHSHADYVRIPCIVFFVATPIFVGIRIYNRISRRTGLGWDDGTIIISFACTLAVTIPMMFACNYGFGKHFFTLSTEDKLVALRLFYVAQIFYKITINLTKISILLLYRRIFVQRWFRISSLVLMCLITAYMIATTAASIWQCNPIAGAWDKSLKPTCISLTKNWYANAGFAIATDVLILALPMQPIWTSKLPVNQKRALMLVFALGGFVTVTSILRATTLDFSTTSPDITYDIASTLWTMIEVNVAIICACLPMCRMVLAWILPSIFATNVAGNTPKSPDSNNSDPTITIGQRRTRPINGEWHPYAGPPKLEGVNHIMVHHPDQTSEEYILQPVERPGPQDDCGEGAIRKTTHYEVSYERDSEGDKYSYDARAAP